MIIIVNRYANASGKNLLLMNYRNRSGEKKRWLVNYQRCPESTVSTVYFASMASGEMLGMAPCSRDAAILERKILCKTAVLKATEVLRGLGKLGRCLVSSFIHWEMLIYWVNFAKACWQNGDLCPSTPIVLALLATFPPHGYTLLRLL